VEVRSAVVPAAGLGTRFLPASKSVPKELMPIGDRPALQHVIDEAVAAGFDHIVVVSNVAKPAVEHYLTPDPRLVADLRERGRDDTADRLEAMGRDWTVDVVFQERPLGLGHAVGCASEVVRGDAFAVMLPDEIMGAHTLLERMTAVCRESGGGVVGLLRVPADEVSAYGVIEPEGPLSDGVVAVRGLVEKPAAAEAPSDLIVIGRYVLTVDVFDRIRTLTPGLGGELQLTDALREQAANGAFHGVLCEVERWDTGNPVGFAVAAVDLGLRDPVVGPALAAHLDSLR
jgi:UTP--glucose-1-phosphate uridylyltransferase